MTFDIRDRNCVVTGASSGIGRFVALTLAMRGANVVLACRDRAEGERVREEITSSGGAAELVVADLAKQAEVRAAAVAIRERAPSIALLVNNAGANFARRNLTEDGLEATFAVNCVATRLLSELLLDPLRAGRPSRIVNVASGMLAAVDFDDLDRSRRYRQMAAYAQSKMAVVLYTRELARRIGPDGVTAVSMTPGMVGQTRLGRDVRGALRIFLALMAPFMRSAADAGVALVDLATSEDLSAFGGEFFARSARKDVAAATDADAARLWALLHDATLVPEQDASAAASR